MSAWTERADRAISSQLASYRHELASALRRGLGASDAARCPRCGSMLAVRVPSMSSQQCPRCLARRIAVEFERFSPGSGR
jgi:ribosomal protein S27AE